MREYTKLGPLYNYTLLTPHVLGLLSTRLTDTSNSAGLCVNPHQGTVVEFIDWPVSPCRVSDALLVYLGDPTNLQGADFIVLSLQDGHIAVYFNNLGGLSAFTAVEMTSGVYNDSELHQIRLVFRSQADRTKRLELLVDNSERVTVTSM